MSRIGETLFINMEATLPILWQASEVVDPASNSTAVVLITVLDANDNSPKFLQNSYHFNIREDLALPGYIVTDRFNVQDEDVYVSPRMRKCI